MKDQGIIVFSHLRWEFVTQRPHHIMTRLATLNKIIFIEEAIDHINSQDSTSPHAHIFFPLPGITVVQPYRNKNGETTELKTILEAIMIQQQISQPVLWFYSPAWVNIIDEVDHSLVVYDCMDELSAFKGAATSLISEEKLLLDKADVVFTGGKSLFEAKKKFHDHIFCFPSAVDHEHFRKKDNDDMMIPEEIRNISAPVVLYYGVIDERIDLGLLKDISDEMPQIAFVMVGPVVKIDPSTLPQNPNIYYTGSKPYELLPSYLKASAITMMPFALNESTRYISPTKTLEYFAAGKPVISTYIRDVVVDYQYIVRLIRTSADFEAAIEYYLKEPAGARIQRENIQEALVTEASSSEGYLSHCFFV